MIKKLCALLIAVLFTLPSVSSAATDKEKAFTDAYKKAFESKDEATLKGFLYTKGSDPEIVEFFTMMVTGEMGGKLDSIELRDLTPAELKKATEAQPSPSGEKVALLVKPTKKLVLKVSTSGPNGNSSSSSESFVAEVDGKLVIPVPGKVK
jgi:hypothetical protein